MNFYVIGMSNNGISKSYQATVNKKLKILNQDVEHWEATTPATIPSGPLKFADTKRKTIGSNVTPWHSTEKAVWYSHFRLWQHLTHKDRAWIIEHDSYVHKIPTFEQNNAAIFGKGLGCAECYSIDSYVFKNMIAEACRTELDMQVDTFMNNFFKSRAITLSKTKVVAIHSTLKSYGSTITHL